MRTILNLLSAALAVCSTLMLAAFGYLCFIQQWETAANVLVFAVVAFVAALAAGKPDELY